MTSSSSSSSFIVVLTPFTHSPSFSFIISCCSIALKCVGCLFVCLSLVSRERRCYWTRRMGRCLTNSSSIDPPQFISWLQPKQQLYIAVPSNHSLTHFVAVELDVQDAFEADNIDWFLLLSQVMVKERERT